MKNTSRGPRGAAMSAPAGARAQNKGDRSPQTVTLTEKFYTANRRLHDVGSHVQSGCLLGHCERGLLVVFALHRREDEVLTINGSLHGFAFGILYAPAQALFFDLNFEEMIVWLSTGAVFDVIHGISNFFAGLLVYPMAELLRRLVKKQHL